MMTDSPRPTRYAGDTFLYGVCYFPEQWPESMWDDDFRRMAELGMNVVRMGEGAWHLWEPTEGRYDFALFDRAVTLAAQHGLKVILGTPTYTPPAWLTARYPEVLRADFQGQPMHHGSRRHYNYTSPKYLELCRNVVTALAEHYGQDERVIGWQIDNELNCHMDVSFADSDDTAFRTWCQARYGTLGALNDAWGTAFWAQVYSDWDQLHLPRPTSAYHNPAHLLDFLRFTSDSTVEFAAQQYEILTRLAPGHFVTHNGIFTNVDNHALTTRGMDFMSYDSYPAFLFQRSDLPEHFQDRQQGHALSTLRGLSEKYLILEQQVGPGGQGGGAAFAGKADFLHATPRPGQIRLWAWHSVAHGADGVLFFRWRTALYGAETLWHGLNHYGNQPSRRYGEARQLGQELHELGPRLLNTSSRAQAAILYDYDNDSNLLAEQYLTPHVRAQDEALYRSLSERHVLADRIPLGAVRNGLDLRQYQVLFYPNAHLLTHEDVALLRPYVEQGGTLVFGPRAGYKDRRNQAYPLPFPGILRELINLDIPEFTTLVNGAAPTEFAFWHGESHPAQGFAEVLTVPEDAQVLAEYTRGDHAGEAAVARFSFGRGAVVYCGTYLADAALTELYEAVSLQFTHALLDDVPREVEVVDRSGPDGTLTVLLNFAATAQQVRLYRPGRDLLGSGAADGTFTLPPFGVMVLEPLPELEFAQDVPADAKPPVAPGR